LLGFIANNQNPRWSRGCFSYYLLFLGTRTLLVHEGHDVYSGNSFDPVYVHSRPQDEHVISWLGLVICSIAYFVLSRT